MPIPVPISLPIPVAIAACRIVSGNQFTGAVPMPASKSLALVDVQSNYFSSAPTRPKNCSAVRLWLFENCLLTTTTLCGLNQEQRSKESCSAFCGVGQGGVLCSGHGYCLKNDSSSSAECVCEEHYSTRNDPHTCTYTIDPVVASSAATPMMLNGSVQRFADGDLLLTPKANATWGTAFTAAPLPLFSYFNTKATCGYQLAFNASLAFSLDPDSEAGGDGLVFVISAALPDRLGGVGKRSVAVEFDSVLSVKHSDPNDNHVGVNVGGSPVSLASATAPLILNDGHTKHAWIHYDPTSGGTLRVFLSSDPQQPPTPTLRARFSLCSILHPKASSASFYIGFKAASTAGPQAHLILNWTFTAGMHISDLALGFVDFFSSQGFNSFFHYASAGFDPAQDNSPAWASFCLGSVFNGQEIGWDDAIATRRREEVREWESQGPGPVTEKQGTRGKEKDPDWRPAPGEAAGTSGGSGDEGWGGRGGGQAGASSAAAKRPRTSGPVGSGAGGAGLASNSQPQGAAAAAGGSEGSGAAGAGTSAAAAGVAPLGGSAVAGASQRSDRAGRTPTDEELDPWTEEVLRNAEPGLVRGMFSEKDVKEARNCKICKKKISWKGSCTSTGKRHLKRSHYPSLQIWCRRFKDRNKPDNLTFPDGGWGPDVPDQTAWPWEHAATWPRIVQTPDSAVTGGSEVGGSRQMSMAAFVTPRVHGQQLREGLVQLFAAADLPFRLVECREFRAFVQMLNPGAALLLGSRHRLARDMMAYGEAAREDMRQLLVGDGLAGRMSLTFDIWTGENNVAFMGVTGHYVTSDFLLKQAVIDFRELKGSHTGDLIADELEEVLWEWGLEKMLFAVTCDNAENNSRAMRLLAGVPDARPGSRPRHPPLLSRWRHFRYYGAVSVRSSISKETKKAWDAIRLTDAHWDELAELRDFLTPFEQVTLFAEGSLYPTFSAVVPQYNALIDLQEKAQLTPGISPLRSSLITAALSKLERHMGGVSEEAAIATFLDPRQKLAPFKHRARAAEGNSRGATLELGPDRVKALVRARLSEYHAASTTALGDGGEVTSARGAGVHASAGGGAVDASANVSIQ
ncbi:unnamed protein product [Closterium sp. NIES-65]|nr:unnamed protein product [Closterium sp. NIES-65]